jgi:tight adherence protein C
MSRGPELLGMAVAASVVIVILLAVRFLRAAPPLDRSYADVPPRLWAWSWVLVRAFEHHFGSWIHKARRQKLARRLRAAGLEFALTPAQYVAGRWIAAGAAVLLLALAWAPRGLLPASLAALAALIGYSIPASWLGDRIERRRRALLKELPFCLDVMTLTIESGLSLSSALQVTTANMPPGVLRGELERMLRDVRAGRTRADALRQMADRVQSSALTNLVSAMIAVEKQGANLGELLRAQAQQRRVERFLRAEKLAMQAPVKLLLPLVTCIFPGTFIVLFFPIVVRLMTQGVL